MADENEGVYVKFGAKTSELEAGMHKANEAVKEGVEGMKKSMEGINAGFEKITMGFAAFTAAFAGGSALKEFVASALDTTKEAVTLGKTLGINATEASYFASALAQLGISQDTVTAAAKRISMGIVAGGEAFANLGVHIKDSQGHLRNTKDVMLETNAALKQFKEGTDRNVEGMKIYGRQWAEIAPMVSKYTKDSKEAREEAENLNLIIGQESVDAMAKYNTAKRNVGEVMKGIQKTIGDELIPRLTKLGEWFKEIGPEAIKYIRVAMQGYLSIQDAVKDSVVALWDALSTSVKAIVGIFSDAFGSGGEAITPLEFFQNVIKLVQVAFIGLRIGVQEASVLIVGGVQNIIIIAKGWAEMTVNACMMVIHAFETVYVGLKGLAEIAIAAFHFDWEGVKRAAADTGEAIKNSVAKTASDINGVGAAWDKMGEDRKANMQKTIDSMVSIAAKGREDIDKAISTDISKAKPITKIEDKKEGQLSKGADEKKDLEARMKIWETGLVEEKTKYMKQNDMREQSLEDDKKYWDALLQRTDLTSKEKISIEKKSAELSLSIMKRDAADKMALDQESIALKEKIALDKLDIEKENSSQLLALGLQTQQEALAKEQEFENAKYDINEKALRARIALAEKDPFKNKVEIQKLNDAILDLQQKHDLELLKIQNKTVNESMKNFIDMFGGIRSSFENAIGGMVSGAMTLRKGLDTLWQGILGAFSQFVAKKVTTWVMGENAQTAATIGGNVARVASDWWASAQSIMAKAWSAIKNIAMAAWEAAANVYASLAAIPVIGPFIAPAAAVAAAGTVGSFVSHIASAEGGYDIPAGLNPMTQLHEKEMVLPSEQADTIRNMAKNGGGSGSVNVTIHAIDAAGVKKLFMDHGSALIESIKNQNRNFATR